MSEKSVSVTELTQRLAQTPEAFLKPALVKNYQKTDGVIHVGAVISDLLAMAGGKRLGADGSDGFILETSQRNRNRLRIMLVACHLLAFPGFLERRNLAEKMMDFLAGKDIEKLAGLVEADKFVSDPDRREELSRLALRAFRILPEGETKEMANDRLTTLDSAERQRVIMETKKAQERAKQLREEMARKEAEEAASKWSRE